MLPSDVRALVSCLHTCSRQAALVLTGGGASAASWLLAVPGGSRTILEVAVPYAQTALDEYLGRSPDSYCSADTALRLARRARQRAAWLAPTADVVGVACTASLRSDRPKRGEHRIHVAAASPHEARVLSLVLARDQREREAEEEIAGRLLLDVLATAFGLSQRLSLSLLPGENLEETIEPEGGPLAALLAVERSAVCVEPDGRWCHQAPTPGLLVSGSFNPLHEGHRGLAEVASRKVERSPAFELSVVNAEKAPLDPGEVRRRITQFAGWAPVWLTRAPTFVEKARLFPGVVFVVGADTAARIVQPRFYGGSEESLRAALAEIRDRGTRFLVAGRVAGERFVPLSELAIPEAFRDLFEEIPERMFRMDVSSSGLRAGQRL